MLMTLYDLGTHYGEGLRKMLKLHKFDEVYCFEPNPTINVHTFLSDVNHPKLHILKKAAWVKYGYHRFMAQRKEELDGHGFGAGLEGYGSDGGHFDAGMVETVDIVHAIKAYRKMCVVKMDIEGAEWKIIEKLCSDPDAMCMIDTIYIEWHMKYGTPERKYDLVMILKHYGINVIEWD